MNRRWAVVAVTEKMVVGQSESRKSPSSLRRNDIVVTTVRLIEKCDGNHTIFPEGDKVKPLGVLFIDVYRRFWQHARPFPIGHKAWLRLRIPRKVGWR